MLLSVCVILASCEHKTIVESDTIVWPVGTIHEDDTPKTQDWMLVYEEFRRGKLQAK